MFEDIGSIEFGLFTKTAMVSQAEADAALYKFTGAKCGRASLGEKCASVVKTFASLWPEYQTLNVLAIGSFKVELRAKAAQVSQTEAGVALYKITAECG